MGCTPIAGRVTSTAPSAFASLALHKIRFLALSGKDVLGKDDTAELEIQIKLNKEYKILSIQDSGVAFVEKMQTGADLNLIGQNSDLLLLPVSTGSCNSDLLLLLPGALARLASGAPALEPGHGKVCTDQVNAQLPVPAVSGPASTSEVDAPLEPSFQYLSVAPK
ncbi:hypothetical protein QYE76_008809 [Lolium multiflorum]|uniref:Uncharacterized protein n=1 Tax=Lolium multiflorum TaxID=4521 RepID=A0AAD8TTZ6_LOLMU|nr:hypothetical protein QYE76_008809 [Lolium multiflorum]